MSEFIISGPAKLYFAPIGTRTPNKDESFEDAGWSEFAIFDPVPVGLQLTYSLRDLHRNLACYGQWPNTN